MHKNSGETGERPPIPKGNGATSGTVSRPAGQEKLDPRKQVRIRIEERDMTCRGPCA